MSPSFYKYVGLFNSLVTCVSLKTNLFKITCLTRKLNKKQQLKYNTINSVPSFALSTCDAFILHLSQSLFLSHVINKLFICCNQQDISQPTFGRPRKLVHLGISYY